MASIKKLSCYKGFVQCPISSTLISDYTHMMVNNTTVPCKVLSIAATSHMKNMYLNKESTTIPVFFSTTKTITKMKIIFKILVDYTN